MKRVPTKRFVSEAQAHDSSGDLREGCRVLHTTRGVRWQCDASAVPKSRKRKSRKPAKRRRRAAPVVVGSEDCGCDG